MLNKVKGVFKASQSDANTALQVTHITRDQHNISRQDISENALKVLYRLHKAGFDAYLVGGCVRDLMLGLKPKDFDVATNATPEQVKELFRNCRVIGRRFRLAHVIFGRDIIEVATFRGHHQDSDTLGKQSDDGQLLRDNVFGDINQDAQRRDFTINAMYYNIADYSISDFANGMQAIAERSIDLIGSPEQRYREDPVRMLRAVRFAAKLNMQISERSAQPIAELAGLLANIPPARLFEEVLKLFLSGQGLETYRQLQHFALFAPLFPQTAALLTDPNGREQQLIEQVLINTDNRVNTGQKITPAFLYAAMLWYPLEERCQQLMTETDLSHHDAFNLAGNDVLHRQVQRIMIPKRFSLMMRDIWQLQQRLPKRGGRRAFQLASHPKFRAAYDFLLMRAEVEGGKLLELSQWWTDFQAADEAKRKVMAQAQTRGRGGVRNARRRPRKPRTDSPAQ